MIYLLSGTVRTYLGSVVHYLSFVKITKRESYDLSEIDTLKSIISNWQKTLRKEATVKQHLKNELATIRYPTADELKKFDNHSLIKEGKKICRSPVNSKLGRNTYCKARDYLTSVLLTENMQRPAAIANMTLQEYQRAYPEKGGKVIKVFAHKTEENGPASIGMPNEVYNDLVNYVDNLRPLVPNLATENVFVSVQD